MAALLAPASPGTSPVAGASRRLALETAALCAALLLPSAIAAAFDTRTLHEVSVWAKPMKFQFSFALHWLTIAWLLGCLDAGERDRPRTLWPLRAGGVAAVAEVLYITVQAARGRHSHFNFDTGLETFLYYALMGGAAVAMMAVTAWTGWRLWRHPAGGRRDGLWCGAVLGLLGGSLVTLLVTAPLASGALGSPGSWVGGVRSNAAGLPVFGWSVTGGDLRVPHFFAAHLLQALPLVGWLADRAAGRRSHAWVWAAAATGLVLVVATLAQAVAGHPFVAGFGG